MIHSEASQSLFILSFRNTTYSIFHEFARILTDPWNWLPLTESIPVQLAIFWELQNKAYSIETNWNCTELRVRSTVNWTELYTHNRKSWWMSWVICWTILMKPYLWAIDSARAEQISTEHLNKSVWKGCHWYGTVSWTMPVRELNWTELNLNLWKRILNWTELNI